ncbi:MAG: TIGR03943 family protein [Pleurocapsa sp. MO_226.B13]|nr:TIGR03943 family protein [Pleurocapsa sp. MO_226.B13]
MLKNKNHLLFVWLDGLALLAWGILLLKYAGTGQYKLLIHPNYYGLVLGSGIILTILGIIKIKLIVTRTYYNTGEHLNLFPPGFGSSLLLIVAIAGLLIPPKILTSQTAIKRGVGEIPLTSSQPQAFRTATKPQERSLIEWIRTINAYPEPDAYSGQPANITGFALHLEELPDNYLLLSRFVITCCAVDAYPIGIPIKLETSRSNYPPDTWWEIEGKMIAETLPTRKRLDSDRVGKQRSVVLAADSIKSIPTPADPYSYK